MLRNVLDGYLRGITSERDFDAPLFALLPAMGFHDVHFTHGPVEFGKDFIAKRAEGGRVTQYSFQSKCGDIKQADWRNEIQGQMLEAAVSGLSHPQFDKILPHQAVLVTTGRLVGNAALALQELNGTIESKFRGKPVLVWERPQLAEYLAEYGMGGVHQATASGYASYGRFFELYGRALEGQLADRDIEPYSCIWVEPQVDAAQRLLVACVEAGLLAARCRERGNLYEALHCHLAALRAVLHALHTEADPGRRREVADLHDHVLRGVTSACRDFVAALRGLLSGAAHGLLKVIEANLLMAAYPVHCARAMEAAGLLYFLSGDGAERTDVAGFLRSFVDAEPGCGHPIADRYAVSLVPATLALLHAGHGAAAHGLLRRAAV